VDGKAKLVYIGQYFPGASGIREPRTVRSNLHYEAKQLSGPEHTLKIRMYGRLSPYKRDMSRPVLFQLFCNSDGLFQRHKPGPGTHASGLTAEYALPAAGF
jgi:hypothetical protein